MKTVQIVFDEELLQATDRAARRSKRNRSALVREALREYLHRAQIRAWEEQEREAYARMPQDMDEVRAWEEIAAWPEE